MAVTPWRTQHGPHRGLSQGGFHSATAVTPWRTRPTPNRRGPCPCFNSATAVTPWRTRNSASTERPRTLALQFGHGGDAVENVRRSSHAGEFNSALQFGHGGDAV